MKIFHAARSPTEILFFLPTLLKLGGGPHRLAVPTGEKFATEWVHSFRKFAAKFFSEHLEVVATTTDQKADLRATPCPTLIASSGYKHAHALWCGLNPETLPDQWLPAPSSYGHGVVLARSLNEHNGFFPWERLLEVYSDVPLTFCGTLDEYQAFSKEFPAATFCWEDSSDLVAATELLRSSTLLIANQCMVAALADGVGLPTVLEVSMMTQTMLHPRSKVYPSFAGRTFLPDRGVWLTSPVPEAVLHTHWPHGYSTRWVHPSLDSPAELLKFASLDEARATVAPLYNRPISDPEVSESIIHHTLATFPGELLPSVDHRSCRRIVQAIEKFGGPFPVADYFFQPEGAPELKLLTSASTFESSPTA